MAATTYYPTGKYDIIPYGKIITQVAMCKTSPIPTYLPKYVLTTKHSGTMLCSNRQGVIYPFQYYHYIFCCILASDEIADEYKLVKSKKNDDVFVDLRPDKPISLRESLKVAVTCASEGWKSLQETFL